VISVNPTAGITDEADLLSTEGRRISAQKRLWKAGAITANEYNLVLTGVINLDQRRFAATSSAASRATP
jgi:hypothetical protein